MDDGKSVPAEDDLRGTVEVIADEEGAEIIHLQLYGRAEVIMLHGRKNGSATGVIKEGRDDPSMDPAGG